MKGDHTRLSTSRGTLLTMKNDETERTPLYNAVMVPAAVWKGNHSEIPTVRSAKEQRLQVIMTIIDRKST